MWILPLALAFARVAAPDGAAALDRFRATGERHGSVGDYSVATPLGYSVPVQSLHGWCTLATTGPDCAFAKLAHCPSAHEVAVSKGAFVLKLLSREIWPDRFARMLAEFHAAHRWRSVTWGEFRAAPRCAHSDSPVRARRSRSMLHSTSKKVVVDPRGLVPHWTDESLVEARVFAMLAASADHADVAASDARLATVLAAVPKDDRSGEALLIDHALAANAERSGRAEDSLRFYTSAAARRPVLSLAAAFARRRFESLSAGSRSRR